MNSIPLTDSKANVDFSSQINEPCRFCKQFSDESVIVPDWGKRVIAHLVITIAEDGSQHVHGPIEDEKMMNRLIDIAMIETHKQSKKESK